MQSNNDLTVKGNRKKLIIVLLLFFMPAITATLLYTSGWRPAGTVNNGELVVPAKPLGERVFQSLDGKVVKLSELIGKWSMVYFDSSTCPTACVDQLFFMRQIHLSQGKNIERVQRLFILTDDKDIKTLKEKLVEYPNMSVLKMDKDDLSMLLKEFSSDNENVAEQHNIYFVDPFGNLMMRYRPGIEPAGMRKDLERLLKYTSEK